MKTDSFLRIFAIAATMTVAALVLLSLVISPISADRLVEFEQETKAQGGIVLALLAIVAMTIAIVVLGFYLWMIYECGTSEHVAHQSLWLLLILVVPVFGALAYYWVTRSKFYVALLEKSRYGSG